jgi:hypothetical protein
MPSICEKAHRSLTNDGDAPYTAWLGSRNLVYSLPGDPSILSISGFFSQSVNASSSKNCEQLEKLALQLLKFCRKGEHL